MRLYLLKRERKDERKKKKKKDLPLREGHLRSLSFFSFSVMPTNSTSGKEKTEEEVQIIDFIVGETFCFINGNSLYHS